MIEDHPEWGKDVRIIGINADQGRDVAKYFIDTNNYGKVENFYMHESLGGKIYGATAMPHHIIVDKNGTLVFSGGSEKRTNILEDLQTLSKGGVIEGEGAA